MERINSRTRWINRFIKGSWAIYDEENCIMLAEMNSTINENKRPTGSMIRGMVICMEEIVISLHWMRMVLFMKMK